MKIAGVQMDVRLGDKSHNLRQIEHFAREAAGQGAEVVVFPECAVTGYCFASKEEALVHAELLHPTSESETAERLTQICAESNIHVVVGMLEKTSAVADADDTELPSIESLAPENSNLYNVSLLVGPDGVKGVYRKTHLPQLGVDHFVTPGDRPYEVIDIGGLRIGMLICYDASFPEASRVLSLQGADLIVLPTNWPFGAEPTADHVVNARASENKVYFIAVDRVGMEAGFQFIGKSKICDVHGNTLDAADHANQAVIYADIDPLQPRIKRIERTPGKHAIDRFADRRPDLYGPILNRD